MYMCEVYLYKWSGLGLVKHNVGVKMDAQSIASRLARAGRARVQKGNLLLEGASFFGADRRGEGGKEPLLFSLNVGLVEATDAVADGGEVKVLGGELVAAIFGGLDDGSGEVVVELLLSGRVVAT